MPIPPRHQHGLGSSPAITLDALMPNPHAVAAGLPLLKLQYEYARERNEALPSYTDDPVAFIEDALGEELWSKQREVAEAVRDHRRVAVHSAHDIGKSWLAARIIAWWVGCRPDPFAVTTAPTNRQVRAILWREIGRAHTKGKLPGRLNQTEWWIDAGGREEIVAYGRKPTDYNQEAFLGIHAASVLTVLDEASGVPETLFIAADTLTSGGDSRMLAIGNPDDPQSHFASICRPGSGWHVIHIDGLESPNFTKERVSDSLRRVLLSCAWVEEKAGEWGDRSPLYISKVRGLFPDDASDGVVPLSWVRRCQDENGQYAPDDLLPVELGVDVGAGGDLTVVRERCGIKAGRTWRKRTPEPAEAAGLVMQAIEETGAIRVKVDSIGVGWGIAGRLRELGEEGAHKAEIVSVNVSEAPRNPQRFPNLRSEMWWDIGRELSQDGGWDLTDVDDDAIAQLIAPRYSLDSAGRTRVEKKEDTIKRIGHSPDDADALLLAYLVGGKRQIKTY